MLVSFKVMLFIGHRMGNRVLEKKNGIRSTTSIMSKKTIFLLVAVFGIVSVAAFFLSVAVGNFPVISLMIPVLFFLVALNLRKKFNVSEITSEEKNLTFRNILYIGYFIGTNLLALLILFG
jgi:4-hydroxybenzoate polyprenyltransferase